jgi:hypothetical protein
MSNTCESTCTQKDGPTDSIDNCLIPPWCVARGALPPFSPATVCLRASERERARDSVRLRERAGAQARASERERVRGRRESERVLVCKSSPKEHIRNTLGTQSIGVQGLAFSCLRLSVCLRMCWDTAACDAMRAVVCERACDGCGL